MQTWKNYSPTRFQALTSLNKSEFEGLLVEFQPICEKYFRYHNLKGEIRPMPMKRESVISSLYGADTKLFFILYYLKNNSLQESIGAFFGISQGKVSMWTKVLVPLLKETLTKLGMMPTVESHILYNKLTQMEDETTIYQDVTVRPIERSTDWETQNEFYDDKHACHSIKNHIVAQQDRQVLYVSPLYEGRVHDKKLIEEEGLDFPENIILVQDGGYLGFQPKNTLVLMPKRKPRGKEHSPLDKTINQIISSMRMIIEHIIASIKRLRMLKEKIRLIGWQVRQNVFLVATAIHNWRTKNRPITNNP